MEELDRAAAAYFRLNRTDARCLDLLQRSGDASPGDLGAGLHLTSGSVTTMLDRLEARWLIERTKPDGDMRRVTVRLTPAAHEMITAVFGPLARDGAANLERLTDDEASLVADVMRRGREILEQHAARVRELGTRPSALARGWH